MRDQADTPRVCVLEATTVALKMRRMQNLPVNLATASARRVQLALPHDAVLCGDPPPRRRRQNLPVQEPRGAAGPSGKTTTVQGRQRPLFKAPPENGGMLTEASAGAPVAAHVTGNGELATAPLTSRRNCLPSSGAAAVPTTTPQGSAAQRQKPRAGIRTRGHVAIALCSRRHTPRNNSTTYSTSNHETTTRNSSIPRPGAAHTYTHALLSDSPVCQRMQVARRCRRRRVASARRRPRPLGDRPCASPGGTAPRGL